MGDKKKPVTAELFEAKHGDWFLGLWNGIGFVTIAATDEFHDFDYLKNLGGILLEKKFIKKLIVKDFKTRSAEELEHDRKMVDHYGPLLEELEARMAGAESVSQRSLENVRCIFIGCQRRLDKAA